MSEGAFYRPNRPPAPPRPPKPGESIWTIRVDHVTWSCEFRFHGESYGWEAQILREGELVIGTALSCAGWRSIGPRKNETSLRRVVSPWCGNRVTGKDEKTYPVSQPEALRQATEQNTEWLK